MKAWRVGAISAGVCGAGAYLFQIVVSGTLPSWLRWLLTASGSIFILISVALPMWQAGREAKARETAEGLARDAERRHNVKIHDVLIPLSVILAEVVKAPGVRERGNAQQRIKQAVVDSISESVGPPRTRACYFEYDAGPPRTLNRSIFKGRSTEPRPSFREGTDAGDEALRVLDTRASKLVTDADREQPPGWPPLEPREYKTYIQTAVALGDKPLGILTVDALEPGDLSADDQLLMRLLAQLLGCALGINAK